MSDENKEPVEERNEPVRLPYDDSAEGGYSYGEKLALVAAEAMDPKEIGLTTAEEAKFIILPDARPKLVLGDFVTFESTVVPLDVRAEWARQEAKIIPFDKEAWKAENKDTFLLQNILRCGTAKGLYGQTVNNKVLGFVLMLREAADRLEALYHQQEAEAQQKPQLALPEGVIDAEMVEPNETQTATETDPSGRTDVPQAD